MPACSSTCRICTNSGADGIGLYRTELQFMMAQRFPRLDVAGQALLARSSTQANGKPVMFRTLDIGADKIAALSAPAQGRQPGAWAGARSAWRSTGRRCCGCSCARC